MIICRVCFYGGGSKIFIKCILFNKTAFPGGVPWKHQPVKGNQEQSPGVTGALFLIMLTILQKGHHDMPLATVELMREMWCEA